MSKKTLNNLSVPVEENITNKMRRKWKEQVDFLYRFVDNLPNSSSSGFSERAFVKSVYRKICRKDDLTIHQSFTLNSLCNKYQK